MSQQLTDRLEPHRPLISSPLWSVLRAAIRSGSLQVRDSAGKLHFFGDRSGKPVAIRFADAGIERALLFDPQLALGEGYMQGRITMESGSLYDLLELFASNFQTHPLPTGMKLVDGWRMLTRRIRQWNRQQRSKDNVARHYDLPSALYELFLDKDRQYSCAYFPTGNETLEEAQLAKKRHIAAKLLLSPGLSVCDIGSGWGGLALYLAETAGASVTGITLSEEQEAYAKARVAQKPSLNVSFQLTDYRSLSTKFDRIVSVGMFEHVGVPNYRRYFKCISDCLKDDGVALVHTIGRLCGPGITQPFIAKYIFPGGYVPALSEVLPAIESSGLLVTDIEILRLHYAKTLAAWRQNFYRRWDEAAAMLGQEFCRMWEFYLAGCEVAFRYHQLAIFQFQLAKRIDTVPLTREYLRSS